MTETERKRGGGESLIAGDWGASLQVLELHTHTLPLGPTCSLISHHHAYSTLLYSTLLYTPLLCHALLGHVLTWPPLSGLPACLPPCLPCLGGGAWSCGVLGAVGWWEPQRNKPADALNAHGHLSPAGAHCPAVPIVSLLCRAIWQIQEGTCNWLFRGFFFTQGHYGGWTLWRCSRREIL